VTEVPEAEVGGQGIPAKARAHMVALEGLLSLLMIAVNLTFRCTGVHDVDVGARFQQVAKGGPSTGFGDDDEEQIVQCLQHVRRHLIVLWSYWFISWSECVIFFWALDLMKARARI
jgi:hypothetical protein